STPRFATRARPKSIRVRKSALHRNTTWSAAASRRFCNVIRGTFKAGESSMYDPTKVGALLAAPRLAPW
ncbi:MAG: hypothetical protein WBV48_20925, partial [Candidatus Acidiferrales bacterium]